MEDLKIVAYVVVAIVWVVYNNYKKISAASKKRDFSKPPLEVIKENWPAIPAKPIRKPLPVSNETLEKQPRVIGKRVLERKALPQRLPVRKTVSSSRVSQPQSKYRSIEGGIISPSKVVHFEEQDDIEEVPNPLLAAIRNMDFRQGFIWSEVLKRPYN